MIPGGVAFQPGQDDPQKRLNAENRPSGSPEGVQEAIKVLSLRLPKVVGAQASVPTPLLTSGGSAGNSRVDSIVAQVMQKYFPTDTPKQPMAPGLAAPEAEMKPPQQAAERQPESPWSQIPRIVIGLPPPGSLPELPGVGGPAHPGAPTWDGGFNPPGMGNVGTTPDLKKRLDWLPGGNYDQPDTPLI